jgi:hypothetical protein
MAVTDAFGYHALQLGLPELDTLRANRMPHRWVASDSLWCLNAWPRRHRPTADQHAATTVAGEPALRV